jgi:cyclopropane fatty-acyl-phospholipid synthase-like methyltransferase
MKKIKSLIFTFGRCLKYGLFRATGGSYRQYYASRMDSIVEKNSDWGLNLERKFQLDYLTKNGLKPEMKMLDYGCGAISAGRHFISYLNKSNYTGVDISIKVVEEANQRVKRFKLIDKEPHILVLGENFEKLLKTEHWDVMWAQSVFTHTPPEDAEQCLKMMIPSIKSGGKFFASFGESDGDIEHKDFKDWYFPKKYFEKLGEKYDLDVTFMTDWQHPEDPIGRDRMVRFQYDKINTSAH